MCFFFLLQCQSRSTKLPLSPSALWLVFIALDSSCTTSLSLQPFGSPCLGRKVAPTLAPINCSSTIKKFSHLKGFAASSHRDIILVTYRLNEDAPNFVTFLAGCQSFGSSRNNRLEGSCPVHMRNCLTAATLTDANLEVFEKSISPTVRDSSCVIHLVFIYRSPVFIFEPLWLHRLKIRLAFSSNLVNGSSSSIHPPLCFSAKP